ncbi:DUF3157 family protein [Photobacterium japonica]|uniref:DUF3157 family protein n=1 Tax=Photobacterium japonica TaxID=2910235 RepID=UPI003D0BD20A
MTGLFTTGVILLSGLSPAAQSAPLRATLPDGRQVILFDDHTWQYDTPQVTPSASPSSSATPAAALGTSSHAARNATPVNTSNPAATQIANSEIALSSITSPNLPVGVAIVPGQPVSQGTFSRSDVALSVLPATYQNQTLTIPTSLVNHSTNAVIRVDVTVRLLDEHGKVMAKQTQNVWRSIKRMPESYFRPDTQREGRALVFDVPKAARYYLDLKISVVDFR